MIAARLRYRRDDAAVVLHAFDLIELDGKTYGGSRSLRASPPSPVF
jgi:ATP-dependent DNA ligase